jgi:hypothetical protein
MTNTCFSGETLVTGERGLTPIASVKRGQRVLTIDAHGRVCFAIVDAVTVRRSADSLYRIVTDFDEILATANHPIYLASGENFLDREEPSHTALCEVEVCTGKWVDSANLVAGDSLYVPLPTSDSPYGNREDTIVLVPTSTTVVLQHIEAVSFKRDVYDLKFKTAAGYLVGTERIVAACR